METEPSNASPPKRRRRWCQFRLRTLLIGVTLFCVVVGGYIDWRARVARDRAAREPERRRARAAAEVAKYAYSKMKAANAAIPGAVPLLEIQRLERAYKSAAARADELDD